ncbi:amidohydrolase [Lacisediminihabitans profunda]|uniref:Amidohydrolase family protein n=1 Tax=Lacisediminihabitans profunda TaxID=2594790 RepID=A0A5C8UIW1_9MICO|nr:amidohydrolase family protein [Lacisediminihabitans profunda]TXN28117.1 amidohydrolase family protein [Lacisediminihabitans profunda]
MSIVLRNARIVGAGAPPTDLLVSDGSISAIGGELSGDESVDLGGRFVIPGLWDNHVHLTQHALAQRRVDLSTATSAAEAARVMGEAFRTAPPEAGLPLVGFGFRDGLWPDAPSAALLDSQVDTVPVVLVSGDLHCCWLNSAALGRFGYAGRSTGILREDEAFPVTAALQDVPDAVLDAWVSEAARAAAGRGVVGVVDFEMADNIPVWGRRFAAGFDSLRISAGVYTEHLEAAIAAGRFTGEVIAGTGGLLTMGPFKVLIDGSLNTRTAYCAHVYPGLEHSDRPNGILTVPGDELTDLMMRASGAGLLPAVHAIGDEANRIALDAFQAVGCRGRIEHAQLLLDADLPRFAALGVAASVQPEQAMDDRGVADRYWAGRTGRAFVLRSLLDAGAQLLLGSDAPVAPLDPWVTMAAAVGRSRDGLEPWHPEQAISAAEALVASTNGRSRVAVGEDADLVVLDLDPLVAAPDALRRMPVAATMLAGSWTFSAL